jgi:hypothetical protein
MFKDWMGTGWAEDSWSNYVWKALSWRGATLIEFLSRFRGRWRGRGFP